MNTLRDQLSKEIVFFCGAMGTMIQQQDLTEADFRGTLYRDHPMPLKGSNELLCLTQPQLIERIHRDYIAAGAQLIKTNSFNANAVSLNDYGLSEQSYDINYAAAQCARHAVDASAQRQWVCGVLGPTNKTLSLSADVNDPSARAIDFTTLASAYRESIRGLVDGGADVLLIETIFDTLNAKAAGYALMTFFNEIGRRLPLLISATIPDKSGRTLSGQTVSAFYYSIQHLSPLSVGLNCALGPAALMSYFTELSSIATCYTSVHPNAGLPNALGEYEETPERMAAELAEFCQQDLVNIIGGCCGTTPEHIAAIIETCHASAPRAPRPSKNQCCLSGLSPLTISADDLLVNIGERTNVSGSKRFARLIQAQDYQAAQAVAYQQVEKGAQIIDVNMDDALLDSGAAMETFLRLLATEPDIARVPVMIDSSDWNVLERGLQNIQGKGIVNSISLKDGEAVFIEQARRIRYYGAAVVVMAFDEKGQAETAERKIAICQRAYPLLREKVDFPACDIIFDVNVFAIATGIAEHNRYAVDFLAAIKALHQRYPEVLFSGGVSNLSFAFRGNEALRAAMHTVFLYHAYQNGLNMAIVNAGELPPYQQIDEAIRERIEDAIFNRRSDASERLLAVAQQALDNPCASADSGEEQWREHDVEQRIVTAMVRGNHQYIESDCAEALEQLKTPLKVIDGPLMKGMNIVGDMFGAGQLFLPQVIKSARVMKQAVAYLEPFFKQGEKKSRAKIVLATVKGDVHDIGKNIVGIVLQCNGYEIIDCGVMVPAEKIIATALQEKADIIGLSGLITPSLNEMVDVAKAMERQGLTLPLLIGGAATSKKHTALKIDPHYTSAVIYVRDASKVVTVVNDLLSQPEQYLIDTKAHYAAIRSQHNATSQSHNKPTIDQARKQGVSIDWSQYTPPKPKQLTPIILTDYPLIELMEYIDSFFSCLGSERALS
jgi:5-methyltetrahydrofolate--homocysteine methyltransferase